MADTKAMFLKVFKAELEDLLEDIGLVEKRHAGRLFRNEITDYVYKENDALFRLEAEAIREVLILIDGIDLSLYTNVDQLCAEIDRLVRELVKNHEEPEVICSFIARKIKKVLSYVTSGDGFASL